MMDSQYTLIVSIVVVKDITVTNGGSGYTSPPVVTVDAPTGPGIAIPARATATVENGTVTTVTVIIGGSQYTTVPNVTLLWWWWI